jgi:hypothetical protein
MSASTQKLFTKCPSKYVIFQALSKRHIYRAKPAYGDDVITSRMKARQLLSIGIFGSKIPMLSGHHVTVYSLPKLSASS